MTLSPTAPVTSAASASAALPARSRLDLRLPLPPGLVAVEASAGTGKTFALTALATRALVVGGRRTDELLVVTFTRAAAAELRARVRGGLRAALDALRTLVDEGRVPDGLPVWLDALCRPDAATDGTLDPETARVRAEAAARALSTLERATIATLHGFCQASLGQLGLRGTGTDARLHADIDRLRRDVLRDRLLQALIDDPHGLSFSTREGFETPKKVEDDLDDLVRAVLSGGADIVPSGACDHPVVARRAAFVAEVVAALRARLDLEGELSFDEMVRRMAMTLADPALGPVAVRRLRTQARTVLVDEMQDTDGVQWEVLRRAFLDDPDTLGPAADVVIVGDPKQSIYRFRGADIHAYLAAIDRAGPAVHTLDTNWRSSAPLLGALDVLLRGATFGDQQIAYRRVASRPDARPRLHAAGSPLELRWLPTTTGLALTGRGLVVSSSAQASILEDLCGRVVELLAQARIGADPDTGRALEPADIAVLVRSNRRATQIVDALNAVGVPAVQPKGGDVYDTPAFGQLRILLAALAEPADLDRVRALALTWFVTQGLAAIDQEADLARLQERCVSWRQRLAAVGMLPLLAELRADPEVALALARAGERGSTDLEHLAELVHVGCGARGAQATVALHTLEELSAVRSQAEDGGDGPAVRRIDSDGAAVQVMTFHRAKGLQFPVVLLPDSASQVSNSKPWSFHSGGRRVVDAGSGATWRPLPLPGEDDVHPDALHATKAERERRSKDEIVGDESRLLYVALTRAEEKAIVWWAPTQGAERSMLAHLLLEERDEAGVMPVLEGPSAPRPDDATTLARLRSLADRALAESDDPSGASLPAPPIAVHAVSQRGPIHHHRRSDPADGAALEVARLTRSITEPDVWRWSFTGLLRGASAADAPVSQDGAAAASVVAGTDEPDRPRAGDDEPAGSPLDVRIARDGSALDSAVFSEAGRAVGALIDVPGGADFGVLVHEVLEVVDLAAPALDELVRSEVARRALRAGFELDPDRIATGLLAALRTPLEPIAPGWRLVDVAAKDRVAELAFDLALGDTHTPVPIARIAACLAAELPEHDPYRASLVTLPERLDRRLFGGWLTGVVDVAMRTPDGRYLVVDYKTNRLTDALGRPAYDPSAMHAAMVHGEYPFQALLYLVGLHRILQRRLPDYDPEVHLGGSAFLFLRGMVGPDTPLRDGVRDGVSVWRPPAAAVIAVADILAGAVER